MKENKNICSSCFALVEGEWERGGGGRKRKQIVEYIM
jgi:hypothetical protein